MPGSTARDFDIEIVPVQPMMNGNTFSKKQLLFINKTIYDGSYTKGIQVFENANPESFGIILR